MKKNFRVQYIIITLLIGLFIILSTFLVLGKTNLFDNYIYQSVITLYPKWTVFFTIITFFGSTIFIVSISLCCLLFIKRNKNFFIVSCIGISTLLNNLLKIIFKRGRPSILMLVDESSYSFPSGHTMASTSLYGLFIYLIWKMEIKKTYKILFTCFNIVLIVLIGISRIYLGVHFATDVIGSMIVSLVLINVFIIIFNKYFNN